MKSIPVGPSGLTAPNVVLGIMRIADKTDDEIRTLVAAARDAGIDFFDHADVYGTRMHECEERFANAMHLSPSQRAEITIQTKAGIVREGPYFDFSYERIVSSVEGSLRALQTDYIDILLLHRPDALVEPDEVARAFDELEAAGKVRAFGVSNHTPRQIDLLKTAVTQSIVANQLQLSLTHAPIVAQGVATNMHGLDQSVTLDGGGILDRLAAHYGVPPIAIATAWITRHPAQMQVVLGTTTPQRVGRTFSGPANLLVRVSVTTLTRTRSIETGRGFYERQQRRFNSKQRPGYEVTGFMSREI